MRVALDEQIFAVQRYGGISRLFATLAREYLTADSLGLHLDPMRASVINRYLLDDPLLADALGVRAARTELAALGRYLSRRPRRSEVDVVHSTFYLPHGLADHPGIPKVMTIHDMIPELFPDTRRRLDFLTLKRRYVQKADHIICVSEATRVDLERVYGVPAAPVTVVHHGVDPSFHPGAAHLPSLPDRYVLFVGNRDGYKDAATLVRAFHGVAQEVPDLTLLFVGGGRLTSAEQKELTRLGLQSRVMQVALTDEDMPSAYAHAEICVFPSRYEGFGLPALEAMSCGTPLVLADASSLPEVGGDAALYFPPGDSVVLAETIRSLIQDGPLRESLSRRGLDRARGFSWAKTAARTADVYRQVVEGR